MNEASKKNLFLVITMIILAASTRIFPHPPNVTAIGAMGLLGAAYLPRKVWAFIVPFVALWLSDLAINNIIFAEYYDGFVWFTQGAFGIYLGFGLIVLLGIGLLKKVKVPTLIGASLGSSFIFYLASNFGSWMSGFTYPKTGAGLIACYTAGLPFLLNTILGDLFFVGVLFGAYALFSYKQKSTSHILDA